MALSRSSRNTCFPARIHWGHEIIELWKSSFTRDRLCSLTKSISNDADFVTSLAYPDQVGITPSPLKWGAADPSERGPVICSRVPSTIKHRNAVGAHSGSYSIYRALSIAMGSLSPSHKPDYNLTEPPVAIPPQPAWSDPKKIVSFDPWGHLVPSVFKKDLDAGLDVHPSIAITKAHIKLSETDESARKGDLVVDGKIVLQSAPLLNADGTTSTNYPGVEINVSKVCTTHRCLIVFILLSMNFIGCCRSRKC
jgi:hypothetical protein